LTFVVFRRQSRKFRVARREFHSKEAALWILEGHRVRLFRQRVLDMIWFGVNGFAVSSPAVLIQFLTSKVKSPGIGRGFC